MNYSQILCGFSDLLGLFFYRFKLPYVLRMAKYSPVINIESICHIKIKSVKKRDVLM